MLAEFLLWEQGHTFEGYVEGDDGIFVTDGLLTKEMYAELGFSIKIEEFDDPCTASFCGLVFSSSHQIIRDPFKFVSKFAWTHTALHSNERIQHELLRGKALSALYETPHCPIVAPLASHVLNELTNINVTALRVEDRWKPLPPASFVPVAFAPTEDTRLLFQKKFGISPNLQRLIEQRIRDHRVSEIGSLLLPYIPLIKPGRDTRSDYFVYSLNYVY